MEFNNKLNMHYQRELQETISISNFLNIELAVGSIIWIHERYEDEEISLSKLFNESNIIDSLKEMLNIADKKYTEFNGILSELGNRLLISEEKTICEKIKNLILDISDYQFDSYEEVVKFINEICFDSYTLKTPESIINIIVGLIDINKNIKFADYCSGISQVAISIHEKMMQNIENYDFIYHAEDINQDVCLISKILMVINGIKCYEVCNKDVLANDEDNNQDFDFIFSDIPQAMEWNNRESHIDKRFKYGIPNKLNADWAFYQNTIYHLNEKGIGIATATKGALARSIDKDIREKIIEEDLIEAVISLPANLYLETGIETELIIFNKNKCESRKNKIMFINASEYSSKLNRNQSVITEEGIDKIIKTYKEGIEELHFSKLVNVDKIKQHEYTLNSKEYLEFDELTDKIRNSVKLVDIAHVSRGVQISKSDMEKLSKEPAYCLLNIKDIENGKVNYDDSVKIINKKDDWFGRFDIREDDIIITLKGSSIKMAIVNDDFKSSFISANLARIRVDKNKYNPYVLYEFLQSEIGYRMLEGVQVGTTIKLLNPSQLDKIQVPIYDIDFMNEVGREIKNNKTNYEKTIEIAELEYEENRKAYKSKLNF